MSGHREPFPHMALLLGLGLMICVPLSLWAVGWPVVKWILIAHVVGMVGAGVYFGSVALIKKASMPKINRRNLIIPAISAVLTIAIIFTKNVYGDGQTAMQIAISIPALLVGLSLVICVLYYINFAPVLIGIYKQGACPSMIWTLNVLSVCLCPAVIFIGPIAPASGLIIWVVALIYALAIPHTKQESVENRVPCPTCAEYVMPGAKKCRFCGEILA